VDRKQQTTQSGKKEKMEGSRRPCRRRSEKGEGEAREHEEEKRGNKKARKEKNSREVKGKTEETY